MFREPSSGWKCSECAFELWIPVAESRSTRVGIYNDARFPGRCIVALRHHYDQLEEVPLEEIDNFMRDVLVASASIKETTGAARVNVSILGNRDPHVHAHLIPRYPEREEYPNDAPWRDPRENAKLSVGDVEKLRFALSLRMTSAKYRRNRGPFWPEGKTVPYPRLFTERDLRFATD